MIDVHQLTTPGPAAARAFVMLNADIRDPGTELDGYYDPATQTWIGGRQLGLGSYSQRSNGSKGGYSSQSDD